MMHIAKATALPLLLVAATSGVFTQAPAPPGASGPAFDVVSIKRNTSGVFPIGPSVERPDGGFRMIRVDALGLINRAYLGTGARIGLPDWARTEFYDISTTSTLARANADDRIAMLRAMLADRFKLVVHVETREQPVYDLVLARRDGRLGSGLTPVDADCDARLAADRAAAEAVLETGPRPPSQRPDFKAPPPPCTLRTVGASLRDMSGDKLGRLGDLMEGETSMDTLAKALRWSGRPVVNKTGLTGSYRVRMDFDMTASFRGPDIAASAPEAPPTVFTAVQEQLGLKLESSRAPMEVLVIDRLEHPTED